MIARKNLVYFLMTFALASHEIMAAPSATASGRNMEISINPAALIGGGLNASYRFAVKHNVALGLHLNSLFFGLSTDAAALGVGGGISGKFFLTNDAFVDSWYIEPALNFSSLSVGASNHFWRISPQVIAGYGWVWPNGFSLSLGLGIVYNHAFGATNLGHLYQGVWPTGDFSIGYAW